MHKHSSTRDSAAGTILACVCGLCATLLVMDEATAATIVPVVYVLYFLSNPANRGARSKWFMGTFLAAAAGIYAFIAVMDPFDFLEFSPRFHRHVFLWAYKNPDNNLNDRFWAATFAKRSAYDSAIFGNSAVIIHQPLYYQQAFADVTDMHMVNLSMRGALPYEQTVVMHRFLHYHRAPKMLVFVMNSNWCSGDPYRLAEAGPMTDLVFPLWMLDNDPWNDYAHIFTLRFFGFALRQFAYLAGILPDEASSVWDRTGSSQDLGGHHERPHREVIMSIYGPQGVRPKTGERIDPQAWDRLAQAKDFPRLLLLRGVLDEVPASTIKIVMLAPEHYFSQPYPGSAQDAALFACKTAISKMLAVYPNTHMVDYMIDSSITRNDSNYYDAWHYNYELAARLPGWTADAVRSQQSKPEFYRYVKAGEKPALAK